MVSLFRLLRRFVKGEEVSVDIFDYVLTALEELVKEVSVRSFVLVSVQVRVMAMLGYVDTAVIPEAIRNIAPKDTAKLHSSLIEQKIKGLYTQAIDVSHL